MKRILLLLVIIVAMVACQNPRARTHMESIGKLETLEKVIILNIPTQRDFLNYSEKGVFVSKLHYLYKVNRFEKGVVGYAYEMNVYNIGDTIFVPINKIR